VDPGAAKEIVREEGPMRMYGDMGEI
jgi:hypothetical protein